MYVISTGSSRKTLNICVCAFKMLIHRGTRKCELNWELDGDNWRKDH